MTGKLGRHPAPPLRYRLEGFQLAFACAMVALYCLSLHAARILAIRLFDGVDGRNHSSSDVGRVNTLRAVASRATPEDVDWLERACFAIMCSLCAKSEAMRDFARELAETVSDECDECYWPAGIIVNLAGASFWQPDPHSGETFEIATPARAFGKLIHSNSGETFAVGDNFYPIKLSDDGKLTYARRVFLPARFL